MATIFILSLYTLLIQRGLKVRQPSIDTSEDNNNSVEGLDQPIDFSGIPIQVNWNTELPANISVPPVNIHSLVLDFSAVSFLDISALKGLKAVKYLIMRYSILYISTGSGFLEVKPNYTFVFFLQTLKEFLRIEVDVYIVACDGKTISYRFYLLQTILFQNLFIKTTLVSLQCTSWRNFINVHFLMTRLRRPSFTPHYMMPCCTFWRCIQTMEKQKRYSL